MNILILSSGTRNKIVEYFKRELAGKGKVVCADCSPLAPALYFADKYYIVPRITDPSYIDYILEICKKEEINGVFSLIDPELSLLAKNKEKFLAMGILPFVSNYEVVEKCFDKYGMYLMCNDLDIMSVKSYISFDDFFKEYKECKIDFPVFVKPYNGSCSNNINKVSSMDELKYVLSKNQGMMIQEFMDGTEYGIDVYVDVISREIISIFAKKKLLMRAGETDKAVSVKNQKLLDFVYESVKKIGLIGQIDIDIFEKDEKFYISEINPRFGGGYPHAYECNCNFPEYMIRNILGHKNVSHLGEYEEGVYMMKYLEVFTTHKSC